ncbi:MAG: hypothetical protein OEV28_07040 [Nitrospirota bacterium]|nr:hypothetical protein [Nitrospirota bacterium]
MALKPITLRLDEEEYEKLKQHLGEFGDPDINVAYVVRAYIRDLNRTMPFLVKAGWDLKNYFGMLGSWLKQFSSMGDAEMLSRMMVNPWAMWNAPGAPEGSRAGTTEEGKSRRAPRTKTTKGKEK